MIRVLFELVEAELYSPGKGLFNDASIVDVKYFQRGISGHNKNSAIIVIWALAREAHHETPAINCGHAALETLWKSKPESYLNNICK